MDTKPFRIFLLGACVGLGAVVGLAPAGHAQPVVPDPVFTSPTTPPPTIPPGDDDGCVPVNCDRPDDLADPCSLHPDSCTPDTTSPPDGDPGEVDEPGDPSEPSDESDTTVNPDIVVVRTPRFTG